MYHPCSSLTDGVLFSILMLMCLLTVKHCADFVLKGILKDGEYLVYANGHSVKVVCELVASGGGWTVSVVHTSYGQIGCWCILK